MILILSCAWALQFQCLKTIGPGNIPLDHCTVIFTILLFTVRSFFFSEFGGCQNDECGVPVLMSRMMDLLINLLANIMATLLYGLDILS
jgi:hypothetical protein